MFPFPGYVFALCFLGGPWRPVGRVIFSERKRKHEIFRVRQYGAFWLQHSHCGHGYHISLPTDLNLESAEISVSKLANSKQQMSKSIQQCLKCENFGAHFGGIETLEWCNPRMPHKCSIRFFGHLKKCCFFGPRLPDDGPKKSWLSGWLSGWLAI